MPTPLSRTNTLSPARFTIWPAIPKSLDSYHDYPVPATETNSPSAMEMLEEKRDSGVGSQSDSSFFDLQPPQKRAVKLEETVQQLFSDEHLLFVLGEQSLCIKFSKFLHRHKPHLVPSVRGFLSKCSRQRLTCHQLVRFLDMRKAIKAIEYANAVARKIRWPNQKEYCNLDIMKAAEVDLRFNDYASRELVMLCREALPAWVTFT